MTTMHYKAIRTPEDLQEVLSEIETLMDTAEKGTPEGDHLEILLCMVQAHEDVYVVLE